ncbi:MAG: 3-keto-disaccharide hydrolase [Gemmataceae bacterium]
MRYLIPLAALLALVPARAEDKKDDGFVSIYDGKSLAGWKVSAKSGHSRASKNTSGGRWVVEDGAIVGSQDVKGNGGIVITEKEYGDFEVVLEMKNDFGPDSGLFLRSNEKGQCYQAMIDYHAGGNVMGVYGEGIGGFHFRNYSFTDKVTEIKADKRSDFPLAVKPEEWAGFWKHGEWMELRARIEGNPPTVTTWIKDRKMMVYKGDKKHLPDRGGIALQVHGGGDHTKEFVRYRNIRVKELK